MEKMVIYDFERNRNMGILFIFLGVIYYMYMCLKASLDDIQTREYSRKHGMRIYTDHRGRTRRTSDGKPATRKDIYGR